MWKCFSLIDLDDHEESFTHIKLAEEDFFDLQKILTLDSFSVLHPSGPDFYWVWAPPFGAMTHTKSRNGLAENGLVRIGQIRMAKTGLARVGPFLCGHVGWWAGRAALLDF